MQSKRIAPLVERAKAREDEVAKQLAERTQALSVQEQRLADLARYAAEYSLPSGDATSLPPALLANRRAFLAKIEGAVAEQQRNVERVRERCDIERTRLLLASRDKQVLEKLSASYLSAEAQREDKRLQNELDQLAARRRPAAPDDDHEGERDGHGDRS